MAGYENANKQSMVGSGFSYLSSAINRSDNIGPLLARTQVDKAGPSGAEVASPEGRRSGRSAFLLISPGQTVCMCPTLPSTGQPIQQIDAAGTKVVRLSSKHGRHTALYPYLLYFPCLMLYPLAEIIRWLILCKPRLIPCCCWCCARLKILQAPS